MVELELLIGWFGRKIFHLTTDRRELLMPICNYNILGVGFTIQTMKGSSYHVECV